MFFYGHEQAPEFAEGALAFRDLMIAIDDPPNDGHPIEPFTQRIFRELDKHTARTDQHRAGFLAAMAEWLAYAAGGYPRAPEKWHPLGAKLQYIHERAQPPHGAKLYEFAGAPVSIAPDLTVHVWPGEDPQNDDDANFLARVQKRGRPISRRTFNALRARQQQNQRKAA